MCGYSRFLGLLLLAGGLLLEPASAARAQQPKLQRAVLTASAGPDSLLRLGSTLTLEAAGLPPGLAARGLTLYLNGVPLRGLAPLSTYTIPQPPAPAAGTALAGRADSTAFIASAALPDSAAPAASELTRVVFALRRTAAPAAWALADGPPWQEAHPVRLGLGTEHCLLAEVPSGQATRLAPAEGWPAGLGVAVLAGLLLLVAAARSWLLRAPVPIAYNADGQLLSVLDAAPPYSLARVQLAWWSWLVLGGGLVSAGATGALPAVPAAVLALLGVSAGTAVLAALPAARPPSAESQPQPYSRGWLADLLCDERGLAIHRLQFVLASLAVGGSFGYTLYTTGVLPVWSPGPAVLLALSSLAYLGPKWRRMAAQVAAAPVAAPAYLAWPAPLPAPAGPPPPAPGPDYAVATHPDAMPWPVPLAPAPPAPMAAAPPAPRPAATRPADLPPVGAAQAVAVPIAAAAVAAPVLPQVAVASQSRADLETGEVLYHEEEDMGPLEDETDEDYPTWPTGS